MYEYETWLYVMIKKNSILPGILKLELITIVKITFHSSVEHLRGKWCWSGYKNAVSATATVKWSSHCWYSFSWVPAVHRITESQKCWKVPAKNTEPNPQLHTEAPKPCVWEWRPNTSWAPAAQAHAHCPAELSHAHRPLKETFPYTQPDPPPT